MSRPQRTSFRWTALLVLLLSLPVLAQSPPIDGLAHIAIAVQNLAQSRNFYNKLGFEEAFHFGDGDTITQSFLKVNDRQFIELYPTTAKHPAGFLHLCFEGADLNALHDFDLSRGLAPISVRKARAGNLLFTVEGPERQNIEYTQYLPGSFHSNDRGQHLGPHRIATGIFAVGLAMRNRAAARAFYLDKLSFTPVTDHAWLVEVPGPSHQQIFFEPASLLPHALTFFHVDDLDQTAAELKRLGVPASAIDNAISVTDPDGNILVFQSAPDADQPQP